MVNKYNRTASQYWLARILLFCKQKRQQYAYTKFNLFPPSQNTGQHFKNKNKRKSSTSEHDYKRSPGKVPETANTRSWFARVGCYYLYLQAALPELFLSVAGEEALTTGSDFSVPPGSALTTSRGDSETQTDETNKSTTHSHNRDTNPANWWEEAPAPHSPPLPTALLEATPSLTAATRYHCQRPPDVQALARTLPFLPKHCDAIKPRRMF